MKIPKVPPSISIKVPVTCSLQAGIAARPVSSVVSKLQAVVTASLQPVSSSATRRSSIDSGVVGEPRQLLATTNYNFYTQKVLRNLHMLLHIRRCGVNA